MRTFLFYTYNTFGNDVVIPIQASSRDDAFTTFHTTYGIDTVVDMCVEYDGEQQKPTVQNFTPEQDQYLQLQNTRAYYIGMRECARLYAHWNNGVQYVGTTGRTLQEALADIDREEQSILSRFKIS